MTWVAVALGAAVGAPLRYLVDRAVALRSRGALPWGTLTVNVVGSLVLGVCLARLTTDPLTTPWWALLGIGFCGAFTTFSTFAWETHRLALDGARAVASANVALTVVVSIGAAALGWAATTAVVP